MDILGHSVPCVSVLTVKGVCTTLLTHVPAIDALIFLCISSVCPWDKNWCILLAAPTANKITRLRVALRHYILVPNRKTGGKKAFVSLKGSVQPGTCGLEEQF